MSDQIMTQRWKITIEYDGGPFVGWQRQNNGFTVQEAIEQAIFEFSSEKVTIQGAGRTDSGVHATGQVAHFDLERPIGDHKIRDAINHFLKSHPVAILKAESVDEEFNARFSASGRQYLYRISTRRAQPVIERGHVWHHKRPLNAERMHDAAQMLLGTHDFTSFRAQECQAKSPIKSLDRLDVIQATEDEIHLIVAARSFLHHQVRNFTGTLALVGEGKWSKEDVQAALEAKNRAAAGPTAPPEGLYLTHVRY